MCRRRRAGAGRWGQGHSQRLSFFASLPLSGSALPWPSEGQGSRQGGEELIFHKRWAGPGICSLNLKTRLGGSWGRVGQEGGKCPGKLFLYLFFRSCLEIPAWLPSVSPLPHPHLFPHLTPAMPESSGQHDPYPCGQHGLEPPALMAKAGVSGQDPMLPRLCLPPWAVPPQPQHLESKRNNAQGQGKLMIARRGGAGWGQVPSPTIQLFPGRLTPLLGSCRTRTQAGPSPR